MFTNDFFSLGEMICRVSRSVSVCKWRDKRDVLFLTTKHRPAFKATQRKEKFLIKSVAISEYNKAKTYIDVSDQVKTYGTATRRGVKWYRKVAIELLCNTAVVNAYILYMACVGRKITVTDFREELCVGLLSANNNAPLSSRSSSRSSTPSTSRPTTPQYARSSTPNVCLPTRFLSCAPKHQFVDTKPARGRCVSCYASVSAKSGRAVASKVSFIHTKCVGCFQNFMCLKCYNSSHSSKALIKG